MDAGGAFDEWRWRGRRSRVVLDTQCRCRRWLAGLVRRGEHEGNRKTIARGMPDVSGVTVVTTLVCFVSQTACEAAGASSARHSLRPLLNRAETSAKSGRIRAAGMRDHV